MIETPCLNICVLSQDESYCLGCGRTAEEIRLWLTYSDEERKKIMAQLAERHDNFYAKHKQKMRRGRRQKREKNNG